MKKAAALLAMPSSSPRGEGATTCCTTLGAAASSVTPAHTGMSAGPGNSTRHLTATEVVHQKFER
jgi:hypothetical protein